VPEPYGIGDRVEVSLDALREVVVSEPYGIGDRVEVSLDALLHCPSLSTYHRIRPECLTPPEAGATATGVVYAYTAANGGPDAGHGNLVKLDCAHACAVALTTGEMRLVG
jgi:hypothetical protein